eukprot:CAMPEP_0196664560 /NCGR_PEP_ID=MMETSP1086-20130531/57602_1 /TAXON_ID=77921 /ORGANISM="Cyanoptyche  gloeocystis , Strain SAG4.97" /LENGTH=154 /DNA_ID=CAMNT_0042000933 /DNA_START=46 /DNA_END=510 /DNA_ORIENTATION=-
MPLPLSLLRTAQGHPMLVELKNGETYNGRLVNCDSWMNINLREVICTSRDGDKFWRIPECYIRGNNIKYLRIPDEVIDMVTDDALAKEEKQKRKFNVGRARGRGRGRVGGDRGGRGGPQGGGGERQGPPQGNKGGPSGRGGKTDRGQSRGRGRQ